MTQKRKKKRPFEARIADRARQRLQQGHSIATVAEYVCHVCRANPNAQPRVVAKMDVLNPLLGAAVRHDIAMADRAKAQKEQQKMAETVAHIKREGKAEAARIEMLGDGFARVKGNDTDRILFGVQLAPADRKLFFGAEEIRNIIALRKTKRSTAKVRQMLDCSLSELNRWDSDGFLPHRFMQRISVGGKMVDARFWLERDVLAAQNQIAEWREQHEQRKRAKRGRLTVHSRSNDAKQPTNTRKPAADRPRPGDKQSGVALLVVMMILALAAVLSSSLLRKTNIAVHQSGYLWHFETAGLYRQSINNWAATILRDDARRTDIDTLQEPWARPSVVLPTQDGLISGHIVDLQGRFNLNNLAEGNSQRALAYFVRLIMTVSDLDKRSAARVAASVKDWIDADRNPTGRIGAEDGYYLKQASPYRTANTRLSTPDTLRVIAGVSPQLYEQLRPYVSALPRPTSINVNTAPAPVLQALAADMPLGTGQNLVDTRKSTPWASTQSFLASPLFAGQSIEQTNISVESHYFMVVGTVTVGKTKRPFSSVLSRQNGRVHRM